jgi:hypothetical protein
MRTSAVPRLLLPSILLFACSPPDGPPGARELIRSKAGGSVSLTDATLWVPAESLTEDATIGLTTLDALPPSNPGRFALAGQGYELTPHGTQFTLAFPALMNVTLDRAAMIANGLDPRTAQLFHFDEETGAYLDVASTFDDQTGKLAAAIEHFSKYVVMAQAAAATAPGPTVAMQGTVPAAVRAGAPIYLRATVIPSAGTAIASVRVFYQKLQPSPQPPVQAVMVPDNTPTMPGSNTYGFLVPAGFLSPADLGPGPDLAYYAEATDSLGITTTLAATPTTRDVTLSYVPGSLTLAPSLLDISAGFDRWLTATATDDAPSTFQLIPDAASVSSCPGPSGQPIGTIDDQRASGIHFHALHACAGTVSVSTGTDTASIPVSVNIGQLASLGLSRYEQVGPAEVRTAFDGTFSLPEGHAIDLDALGSDGFGNTTNVNVTWSAAPAIGTIDTAGRLYALDGAGFGQVTANVGGIGGVTATQWFNIVGRAWNAVGTSPNVNPLNAWTSAGTMTANRYLHTATLLLSGRVLVAGGSNGSSVLASTELYDPATNGWSPAGSMGTVRHFHTATLLPSGKVLVTGGYNGSSVFASTELYDPATNGWTPAGTMAVARYQHTATLLPSGKVLVTGGAAGNAVFASAELYDPATNAWTSAGSMGAARCYHTATLLPNGKVLVAGAYGSSGSALTSAELYDPATNGWTPAGAMSAARYLHAATLLSSGKVIVTGGSNASAALTSAELYDPATNGWTPAGTLGAARYEHTATLLPSGKVLVTGGLQNSSGSGSAIASVELYDPATNGWASVGAMATTRLFQAATLLQSGRVLVTGGLNVIPGAAIISAEAFFASEPAVTPSIAFSGSTPYVAWHEASASANRIYVKHWNGSAWVQDGSSPLNVDMTREATVPRIAFAGSVPYVAWQEASATAAQIYVKHWTGATWVQDVAGSLNVDTSKNAAAPAIAITGTTPYVAWEEQGTSAKQIFVRQWSGTSWAQLGGSLSTNTGLDATRASIALASNTPYVTWEQLIAGGTHTLQVKHWTGSAWLQDGAILNVNVAADAREPMIASTNGVPYVTWRETLGGATNVYVAHWTGAAWILDGGSLSNDPTKSIASPAITFSGATPYVAWRETTGSASQIFVKHLNGSTWRQNGASLNANTTVNAFAPALGFDGANPYAAWSEAAGLLYAIQVKALQ